MLQVMKSGFLLAGAALVLGCSQAPPPTQRPSAATAEPVVKPEPAVIGRLVGRDRTITIPSGERGVVYSEQRSDGTVLAHEVGENELRALAPEVYRQVKESLAVGIADNR